MAPDILKSSDLAGLTAAYIQEQFEQYKNGNRRGARAISMIPVMKTITDDEIRAAAEYYAALKPVADWTDVVEAEMVPKTRVSPTYMRFAIENAGEEPLGNRIIELPKAHVRALISPSPSRLTLRAAHGNGPPTVSRHVFSAARYSAFRSAGRRGRAACSRRSAA